jgi:hypothetical protein
MSFELTVFSSFGTSSFKQLMFKGGTNMSGPFSLNLLRRGCIILSQNFSNLNGDLSQIPLNQQTEFDGFEIVPDVPATFSIIGNIVLEGSNDNLTWTTAASSNFRLVEKGVRFLDGPVRRDPGLRYDYTPPWPLITRTICTSLFISLGSIGTALNGALASVFRVDTRTLGRAVFGGFCLALSLQSLAAGAGFLALGAPDAAFLPFNEAATYFALAIALVLAETFFFDCLGAVAWYLLACRAAADWLIFRDPQYLLADPPVEAIAFAIVAAAFLELRKRFLLTAVVDVEQDRAALDAAWARVLALNPKP